MPRWAYWSIFASIILVALIGISIFFWSKWKVKKIKEKYLTEEEIKKQQSIIEERGSNLATLAFDLKTFLNCKAQDWDIEHWINTVFANQSNKVLLFGKDLEYEVAMLSLKTKADIWASKKDINIDLWNKSILEYPEYFERKSNIENEENILKNKYNLIFANNKNQSNIDIFNNIFSLLETNNGMLVIRQDLKDKTLKKLLKTLKNENIQHEVSSVKSKFIYIVKNK